MNEVIQLQETILNQQETQLWPGYANMLKRWGKNDKEVLDESIECIINESDNMKSLVEKLLFLARYDHNNIKMSISEFDIGELIEEMYKETTLIDTEHDILAVEPADKLAFTWGSVKAQR